MKLLRACLTLIPVIALSGCLEYDEDVTVNADGSGRIQMDIAVLADFIDDEQLKEFKIEFKQIEEELRKRPEIAHAHLNIELKEQLVHFLYDIGVKDYKFLGALSAQALAKGSVGALSAGIQFEELEKGRIKYHRILNADAGQAIRSRVQKLSATRAIRAKKEELEDCFATYRFHAPTVIACSEPGKRTKKTVEWRFPLEFDLKFNVQNTPNLEAEFSLASHSWLWLVAALAVIASGLFWFKSFWAKGGLRRLAKQSGAL
jgi:hypothetical protein